MNEWHKLSVGLPGGGKKEVVVFFPNGGSIVSLS
jgi:hypothetical protein